jgi:predicted HicB family RNase H-like nuclease
MLFLARVQNTMKEAEKPKTGRRPTGKITFPLRIYPETKARLERAAERNRIPLSEFVERTLIKQLDRDGIE